MVCSGLSGFVGIAWFVVGCPICWGLSGVSGSLGLLEASRFNPSHLQACTSCAGGCPMGWGWFTCMLVSFCALCRCWSCIFFVLQFHDGHVMTCFVLP